MRPWWELTFVCYPNDVIVFLPPHKWSEYIWDNCACTVDYFDDLIDHTEAESVAHVFGTYY